MIDPTGHVVQGLLGAIKNIGTGIWNGLKNNYKEMVDKPTVKSVVNWLTLGAVNAVEAQFKTNKANYQTMKNDPSAYNIGNY